MKRLIRGKGVFTCTFKKISGCKLLNSKNEEITSFNKNKNVYLKSDSFIIASININGKLTLYPFWNKDKTNLVRVCKFTGVSTVQIKNMIAMKHSDVIVEHKTKIINYANS